METPVPRKPSRSQWLASGYVAAVVAVVAVVAPVVAAVARLLLDPLLGDHLPFATFFVAVIVAAWVGGLRPALVATVLGFAGALFLFVPPRFSVLGTTGPHLVGLALYFAVCFAIAGFGEAMWRARRRAEEQRERLRTTLASIGDAVITTDVDGRVTNLNAVAEALTGWTNAEAKGQPLDAVFRIVNEQTRKTVENPATRALREGIVVGLANHTVLIARDGTERPIDDSAGPIRCKDGEIVGCVLVFRDISDRHRAERENREAQQQVATTLESITDAFTRFDREWRIVYVNAEAERLTGRPRSELLGQRHWDAFPAALGTVVETEYRRAVAERVTVEFEHYFAPLSRWFAVKGDPTPDGGLAVFFRDITDRKRAESVVRQSEARFRAAVGAVSSLIWTNDAGGMMVGEQPGWGNFTGQDQASYQGYGWSRAVHPDDTRPTIDAWNAAVAGKRPFVFEHRVRRRDGRWRICSIRAVPVFDGGEIAEWVGVHTDITDQREAEEKLRRSEARLRGVFESNVVGVIRWDLDRSLILDANAEFLRTTGYTRDDVAAGRLNFREMTPPEWTPRNEEGIRAIREFGHAAPYEKEYFRKDGSRLPLIIAGTRFEDSPSEGMSLLIDISDRKRAEREIGRLAAESERQRRLFAAVLSSTPDFIYTFDLDGRFVYVNAALLALWGKRLDEAVGRNFLELDYPPALADRFQRQIRHVIDTKQPVRDETPYTSGVGERMYEYIFVPVVGENGAVEAVAGSTRDITDRKVAEEERERLLGQLRDKNRKKDEFLATLAHELRNPLAPIRNGLQIIRMAGANGTVEQARSMMDRQLAQLVRLVDDLLDVSRVTSGKLELRAERIDLKAVIDAAVETSRPAVEQAGHALAVVVPDDPVFVDGDPTRIAQVVSNLLNNSAKYTHRGGHIRLVVGREDQTAVVSVADDGVGIPRAMLGRVFEMFTQVDRTLEKTTGGLGIGLSLVKGLVEMHGGSVEAKSDGQGRGSEFVVRLPVATPAVTGGVEPGRKDEVVVSSGLRRILVVDDNEDAADSLAQLLEMLGNEVRTAYDGEAGVAAAGAFRPNVVLCDIGMPKVNGYDAARRIRAEGWGKNMVLVALTGWGQEDDRRKSADAGFDHHLVKPIEAATLMKFLAGLEATRG